ncbi:DUF4845 domain-containing protein [Endozoicomonas sp.]|uniref:DUF4845 domain-containing protein n=1 Tax=Endozoicomonas sp. TaxID=1892382 RepID=UPI00383BDEEC
MSGMKSRQRGSGALSWLFYLLIGGLLLSFAFKVLPFYMDDHAVNKVVSSLTGRPGSSTASVTQVRTWIDKGLQLNMVKLDRSEVKVARKNAVVAVDIDYERRINFFYNVDLVLTFEHNWKAGTQ